MVPRTLPSAVVDSVDATAIDEALRRVCATAAVERDPYSYQGRDRTAEAAVDAAARDGARRCGCPHCSRARAQRPLTVQAGA